MLFSSKPRVYIKELIIQPHFFTFITVINFLFPFYKTVCKWIIFKGSYVPDSYSRNKLSASPNTAWAWFCCGIFLWHCVHCFLIIPRQLRFMIHTANSLKMAKVKLGFLYTYFGCNKESYILFFKYHTDVCLSKVDFYCLFQCFKANQNKGSQIINSL